MPEYEPGVAHLPCNHWLGCWPLWAVMISSGTPGESSLYY